MGTYRGPSKELTDCMQKLCSGRVYSDLTISCHGKDYKMHKAIVYPRSNFFEGAYNTEYKEGCDGIVELPEDDPRIIHIIIYYLHHQALRWEQVNGIFEELHTLTC
ncbi:hypothetical protein F4677DRAFT_439381 [Hypoxylon crocopeplum]|nr:hypothetical protein F4677DRAFT_439381 [Hypoxylon crocopeplum]